MVKLSFVELMAQARKFLDDCQPTHRASIKALSEHVTFMNADKDEPRMRKAILMTGRAAGLPER